MENDYGFLNIIKSYEDYEEKTNENKHLDTYSDDFLRTENSEEFFDFKGKDKIMFSNQIIQSSFDKMNIFRKILGRQDKKIFANNFKKWKIQISRELSENTNVNIEKGKDYLQKNRKIIEEFCSSRTSYQNDYLNESSNNLHHNYELPFKFTQKVNANTSELSEEVSVDDCGLKKAVKRNFTKICVIKILLEKKIKSIFSNFFLASTHYINSKKLANSSLSLLYIFTQLSIARNKVQKGGFIANKSEEFKQKLNENEKKLSKYEACLNEKADIIASRNDRIEQQIETIELLTEEINRLNNKIEKLEKKGKNLNVIQESLCHKCGNSLEESFIQTPRKTKNENSFELNEFKKTIQEQLEFIVKIEKENRELKLKNSESRAKNDLIMKELEIIKNEFKMFTENYNPRINVNLVENSVQTDDQSQTSQIKKNKNSATKILKSKSKKFANKLNLSNPNDQEIKNVEKNITNYNIININNTSKLTNSNSNVSSFNLTLSEAEKETYRSLRFDNSVLSQEIISLNKEMIKLKNENKNLVETMKKLEKDKNESLNKLKNKTDNYEKVKKENDDLMILIQTSNYKSFISVESENKKLKNENSTCVKDSDLLKNQLLSREKKLVEMESECEKLKKLLENFNKFKNERENLILDNAKLESEFKRLKVEQEESQILLEKQMILLRNREETVSKLTEDINYLNFNTKKLKQDADRSIQDAVTYQQIVRKIEKDLKNSEYRREKVENELNVIKQHLGLKN